MQFSDPHMAQRIAAATDAGTLKRGEWGNGTDAVCMMSAAVPGASSSEDCVTAGWPEWLADLNVSLFDAHVGAEDEVKAAWSFAKDVAEAVSIPRDMDRARDLFLISTLEHVERLDTAGVVRPVIDLLHRRLSGEDVAEDMSAARVAAYAARAAPYAVFVAAEAA